MGSQRVDVVIDRFVVYLVRLAPTVGSEVTKTRPCAVISPDEMNRQLRTVIIAPLTSTRKRYPTRVACNFANRPGEIALDQIRTVDRSRLLKRLGELDAATSSRVVRTLLEMFA